MAEVCVRHGGRREWKLKPAANIVLDERDGAGEGDKRKAWSWTDTGTYMGYKVVPVGDRFLCWVDYSRGFVFLCDMADPERPSSFRYVRLPVVPPPWTGYYDYEDISRPEIKYSRDICGVVGDDGVGGVGALKFVSIILTSAAASNVPCRELGQPRRRLLQRR